MTLTLLEANGLGSVVINVTTSWQRFSVTSAASGVGNTGLEIDRGAATDLVYVWGAQLVRGTKPAAYNLTIASARNAAFIPTGSVQSNQLGQNLITQSEQLNGSAWNATNVTVSGNSATMTDPFGGHNAEFIAANGAADVYHYVRNAVTVTGAPRRMTECAFVKAGSARYIVIGSSVHSAWYRTWFDTQTNTISANDAGVIGTAYPVGNDWYRVCASFTVPSGTANPTVEDVLVAPSPANGVLSYVQAGETVFAFGAQIVYGSAPGAYNPTVASAINTTFAPAGSVKSSQLGQNLLKYSEQLNNNAVWNQDTGGSWSVDSVQAPNGTMTADRRTWPSSTANFAYGVQNTSYDASKEYTFSVWAKVPSGTKNLTLSISDVTLATKNSAAQLVTTSWQRFSFTLKRGQLSNTGYLGVGFLSLTAGDLIDFWGAQLVRGLDPAAYNATKASVLNESYVP